MRNVFEYYMEDDHLEHHGILGMKWGIRRFQNKDGTGFVAGFPSRPTWGCSHHLYSKAADCSMILRRHR